MLPNRRSIRLAGYDYAQSGAYFLTICAHQRQLRFGRIAAAQAVLSVLGHLIWTEWQELPKRFPDIELDEFVVMPNHLHGIVVLKEDGATSVAAIVRVLKSRVDYQLRARDKYTQSCSEYPIWQRNYYEHIIRSEEDLTRIRGYIYRNPATWHVDRLRG